MKKVFLIGLMILGCALVSNAQLNKLEAEAFFKTFPTAKLNVVTNMVSGDDSYKWYTKSLEVAPAAYTMTFGERAVVIKASNGNSFLVVYDKIKTLEYFSEDKMIVVEMVQ